MGGVQFTVVVVLVRVLFRDRPMGDHFGLPVRTDWGCVVTAAVGVAGAVVGGWLVYGPGWLPWWAALAVAFATGAVCERLAERRSGRAESSTIADLGRDNGSGSS